MASPSGAPSNYRGNPVSDEIVDQNAGGLEQEKARRLGAIDALRQSGTNPYPYRFDRSHTLGEIRAAHGTIEPGTETRESSSSPRFRIVPTTFSSSFQRLLLAMRHLMPSMLSTLATGWVFPAL
jgi:lysyl-tRNA synthetase class II